MPRTYRLGLREEGSEQTRSRILAAARELLIATGGFSSFSMEAVARRADVARMTVYHQFGSKIGLLEAICDTLAASGGMDQMASAFSRPDPWIALEEFIAVFGHFWQSDRLLTRRLRGLSALDPEFEQVIRARDERRRQGLTVLVARLGDRHGLESDQVVDILYTLIAFEFFDTLAGPTRSLEDVVPVVSRLAR